MTIARHAFIVVLLLLLSSCVEPVDVGSNDAGADAGTDGGALVCTIGQDQTCNELTSMSALAGTCGPSGCVCLSGFEKGPTGRCRPLNTCPQAPQQPGQACQVPQVTCRYGYEPLECGGRTVRCEGASWVEVEHSDPQASCGGLGLTWQPTTLDFGSTPVGERATLELRFFNPNLRAVELSGLTVQDGTVFAVVSANPGDVTRLTVPAGLRDAASGTVTPGTARVTLRFQPTGPGQRSSTFVATTNLPVQASLSVALRGAGR